MELLQLFEEKPINSYIIPKKNINRTQFPLYDKEQVIIYQRELSNTLEITFVSKRLQTRFVAEFVFNNIVPRYQLQNPKESVEFENDQMKLLCKDEESGVVDCNDESGVVIVFDCGLQWCSNKIGNVHRSSGLITRLQCMLDDKLDEEFKTNENKSEILSKVILVNPFDKDIDQVIDQNVRIYDEKKLELMDALRITRDEKYNSKEIFLREMLVIDDLIKKLKNITIYLDKAISENENFAKFKLNYLIIDNLNFYYFQLYENKTFHKKSNELNDVLDTLGNLLCCNVIITKNQ
ncbi:hypothetical protein PACTADRAFT_4891 [Pachysolen tannophilus NRRL Y-2460]|uniref:Uncharacterized protein n=1 Tax=Pachysolen tannophilus NRRL Y-2460 TaxID=669874 RepID=A0A1E4TQP9_PACTA|nr:hypothetical protein PACTADRAFT_4891 [Pachysolen tannophilus NRRL Y-2460]